MICPSCKNFELRRDEELIGKCLTCREEESRFEGWMMVVERYVGAKFGCATSDLPDFLWRDHYDAGLEPVEAVRVFIREGGAE